MLSDKYKSTNMFQDLSLKYLDFLNNISNLESKKIFKKRYIDISQYYDLLVDIQMSYNYIKKSIYEYKNINDLMYLIKQYLKFILVAEKCYMYNNSDEKNLYANNIDKNNYSINIFDDYLSTSISISFQESYINIPNVDNNPILEFINSTDYFDDNNILFIQINIDRNFGNKNKNEIKFILGSDIPSNDDTEAIMINNAMKIIADNILKSMYDIFNNYIPIYSNINTKINFEEVLKSDRKLWIC